jgi:phosphoribosylaminoimidazole-succinocarboxamide synthase
MAGRTAAAGADQAVPPGDGDAVLLSVPDIGLPRLHRGKVRELFGLPEGTAGGERLLLLVTTDRLSAFDVVFPQGIPGKGRVLTQISALWLAATAHLIPGHLVTTDLERLPVPLGPEARRLLDGRSMVVRRAERIDVECVVRGYLAGSAWREYRETGGVAGIRLPAGLRLGDRLPEPIFTPALKRDVGHDENVGYAALADRIGAELAGRLREVSLRLFAFGTERLARVGLLLADTKFEFGWVDGRLTLIDEVLTPDSSRLWPAERYRPGEPVDSLDKQPVRDYVQSIGWDLRPPAPSLPPDIVARTAERYREALDRVRRALDAP